MEGDPELRWDLLLCRIVLTWGQVGGQRAGNRVLGTVLAENGLEIGPSLSTSAGSSVLQSSSCAIETALQNMAGLNSLRPVENRNWIDLTAAGFGG
jgi:hypothetical protein